jgi:hypothetical protein
MIFQGLFIVVLLSYSYERFKYFVSGYITMSKPLLIIINNLNLYKQ